MWIMTIVKAVKNLSKNVVIKTVSNKYIWYVYSDRRDKEVNISGSMCEVIKKETQQAYHTLKRTKNTICTQSHGIWC